MTEQGTKPSTGRSDKPPTPKVVLNVPLTMHQYAALKQAAQSAGESMAHYLRRMAGLEDVIGTQ